MSDSSKWYECPKCDALYLDQAGTCTCGTETTTAIKGENFSQDNWDTMKTSVEDFKFLWKEYALADDSTLTDDAKELKQQLLSVVKESMDKAYYKGMRDGAAEYKKAFEAGFKIGQEERARLAAKQK